MINKFTGCLLLILLTLPAAAETLLFSCQSCHGAQLEGSEPVRAPALAGQPAAYLAGQLEGFRDGLRGADLEDTYGRQMALMAANLTDEQIAELAAEISGYPGYVRSEVITDSRYAACVSCHGLRGEGNEALRAPYLAGLDAAYLETQMQHFRDGIRGAAAADAYGRQMAQALPADFSDEDIRALALMLDPDARSQKQSHSRNRDSHK